VKALRIPIQALSKHVFTGLSEGTAYVVTVHAKQCVETFGPITITEPDPLTATRQFYSYKL
jgi:hypothetical protein